MPLNFKNAPAATEPLGKAFELLAKREQRIRTEGRSGPPRNFHAAFPHAVYVLGLDEVINRSSIANAARHVGWRYLIPASSPVSAVEISISEGEPQFAELNYGPYAQNTLNEIHTLQSALEFDDQEYELRLLRIPALSVSALWLRGAAGKQIFIPLAPTTTALHSGQKYPESDLIDAIYAEAETVERSASYIAERMEPGDALSLLKPVDLLRLRKYAQFRMKPLIWLGKARGRDSDDLLQEAFVSTFEGRRGWNERISFVQHLTGAIRSISTSWRNEVGDEMHPPSQIGFEIEPPEDYWWPPDTIDPERTLTAKQRLDRIRSLFPEGSIARRVFDLRGQGYSSEEIQSELGMSELQIGAVSRQVRRTLKSLAQNPGD